jgi:Icc-related predicted phosphoesterase
MRILFLSDTHGKHHELQNLPQADMIIHAGDITWHGTVEEVTDFVEWFGLLDYKYKIFIGGNHDFCLEEKEAETDQRFLPENCFYLCNSGITIKNIKIWGIPFFLSDDINGLIPQQIAKIPLNTDILITHNPPLGILDKSTFGANMGDGDLQQRVKIIKPQYHLFGHIHECYGVQRTNNNTTFTNGSVLDGNYNLVNEPIVFDL